MVSLLFVDVNLHHFVKEMSGICWVSPLYNSFFSLVKNKYLNDGRFFKTMQKKKSMKHQKEDRDLSKDLGLSLGFIILDRSLTHFEL